MEDLKVTAYLRAWKKPGQHIERREIVIPGGRLAAALEAFDGQEDDVRLGLAYEYGQNDFQPVPGLRSVSIGDVIELDVVDPDGCGGKAWFTVADVGFERLTIPGTWCLELLDQRARADGDTFDA